MKSQYTDLVHGTPGSQLTFNQNRLAEKATENEKAILINELSKKGVRFTKENVLFVTKTSNEQIVWLEKGTKSAGLEHIISRHQRDFEQQQIQSHEIAEYIHEAVRNGRIVGYQGKQSSPRAIYEVFYKGKIRQIAIQIGNNGFIVSANPR